MLAFIVFSLSGLAPASPACLGVYTVQYQAPLSEQERERQRWYFEPAYRSDLAMLAAMVPNSGRNRAAFRFICRFARWAHAGILSADRLTAYVLEVCRINGLVSEDGAHAVLATIASGLRKSAE